MNQHMSSKKSPVRVLADLAHEGLWKNSPPLTQLLGVCPLLAVSTTLINGVSLGLATTCVMAIANFVVSCLRSYIPHNVRIPIHILIAAALVTVLDLTWNAYFHELYLVIGIFVPLIITNCIVLARIESYAARNAPYLALCDGLFMGIGSTIGLAALGCIRELLGYGTLGRGIEWLVPSWHAWQILPASYPGFLIALLPAGAFFVLAFLVAIRNLYRSSQ